MCRFLLAKFENPTKPGEFLQEFSLMAKKSQAYDGDWQGDGWGVSWVDENNRWQIKKSFLPIWEEGDTFDRFSPTSILAVHARSASFPDQKGVIDYNQPFINEPYVFVFNGLLRKVSLTGVPGKIGAQKIWFLLSKLLERLPPEKALQKIKDILLKNTDNLQALNIGLCNKDNFYGLNYFSQHPDYYQMYYLDSPSQKIICSEKLNKLGKFRPLVVNESFTL